MISFLVSGQSFICVKDHVTELTLICEGVREVNTLNVIPGVSFLLKIHNFIVCCVMAVMVL